MGLNSLMTCGDVKTVSYRYWYSSYFQKNLMFLPLGVWAELSDLLLRNKISENDWDVTSGSKIIKI